MFIGISFSIAQIWQMITGGGSSPSGPSNMVDFRYAENARNFRIFLMR